MSVTESIVKDTSIMEWLLSRIQVPESITSQNKQYAAEVLAIILQSSSLNRVWLIRRNGIDIFLQILSSYRRRDPIKGSDEEEFVENVFDCTTCCVDESDGKQRFLDSEGVELCLIMLKEGGMSRSRALRLLDHALSGRDSVAICERTIDAAGLKPTFSLFMKKVVY